MIDGSEYSIAPITVPIVILVLPPAESSMATRTVGIILNGATSRIGSNQHLKNALAPIRAAGGLAVDADRVVPRVLLVGRNADRLAALAREHGVEGFSTDLDAALSDPAYE